MTQPLMIDLEAIASYAFDYLKDHPEHGRASSLFNIEVISICRMPDNDLLCICRTDSSEDFIAIILKLNAGPKLKTKVAVYKHIQTEEIN